MLLLYFYNNVLCYDLIEAFGRRLQMDFYRSDEIVLMGQVKFW